MLRRLRDELHLVPGRRVDLDGSEAIRFATKLREWQKRLGDDGTGVVFETAPLRPRLVSGPDTFDVLFECEPADAESSTAPKRAEAAAVLRAWRDGLELVPLDDGGWAPLPAGWLAQHGHLVADLLAARGSDKKLTMAALPTAGALCDVLDHPRPTELARLAPLFEGFEGIPRAPLPEGLTATLRGYQQHGVDWLSFLRDAELGGILADDMGLGKTLQTLCVLRGRTLVVCPKSVVYNWADEIARFRPGLRAAIYHGPRRELDPTAEVTLTTYAILRLDADRLAAEDWDAVVLDEAQAIKNLGSQTARAAFELHGKFRIALSGTPVENRLEELWSAMHFANPGLLGGAGDFQERYASPIEAGNPEAASRLRAKIRPFILRRTKAEVVPELPSRTDMVLHVELDEVERNVYDAVRVATKKAVADQMAQGGGVLAALEALLRLRQAACHSALVPGQKADSSSKIERLLEALEESVAEGHKALVFSQWTSLLDKVEPALNAAGIKFTRLDGSTNRPGRGRPRVPGRRRPARHARLAQGRGHGPEPHRRRPRVPPRPVVESGGRGPGREPGPSHRPGPARHGPPHGHQGHGRGAHPRPAGPQAPHRGRRPGRRRPGRRHHASRTPGPARLTSRPSLRLSSLALAQVFRAAMTTWGYGRMSGTRTIRTLKPRPVSISPHSR